MFKNKDINFISIIVALTITAHFLLLTGCGNDSKARNRASNIIEEQRPAPGESLIPLTKITATSTDEEKAKACKSVTGIIKFTCMYDIESIVDSLRSDPNNVNYQDVNGWTSLMWAAKNGYTAIMELLTQIPKINVNLQDKVGRTALIYGISEEDRDDLGLFLINQRNVNLTATDKWGDSALRMAYRRHSLFLVKTLLERDVSVNDKYVFVDAAARDLADYLSLFLKFNAKPNEFDENGLSALGEAARLNNPKAISVLVLDGKANVNLYDQRNRCTPLTLATKNGHRDVVLWLLKNGANPNLYDLSTRRTPLWYAQQQNLTEISELLKSFGAHL